MKTHHNRKLFDRATKNSQRRAFEQLHSEATQTLQQFLEVHGKLFHPETPEVLKGAILRCVRIHSKTNSSESIEILETALEDKAYAWFRSHAATLPLGRYFVWFCGGSGITFNGKESWVPALPIVEAPLYAVVPVLNELLTASCGEMAIVKHDDSAAVVVDTYSGYLPNEPSEKELVYELAYWNDHG